VSNGVEREGGTGERSKSEVRAPTIRGTDLGEKGGGGGGRERGGGGGGGSGG
jgi:hypothetical protein